MKKFYFAFATLVALPVGAAVGCNAILGNEPGLLSGDGGFFDSPANESEASACGAGSKLCANTCLSTTDPANGCSGDCNACPPPTNGQSACNGPNGSCGLGSCSPGFADCDKNSTDGCEALLTSKTSCGSCDNDCVTQGKAFCSPDNSGGLQCSDTCNGTDCCANQACANPNDPAGDCVDLSKNLQHCGSCGNACPSIANASVSCNAGTCSYVCNPGTKDCGNGRCAPLSDTSCGCSAQNCTLQGAGSSCNASTGTCACNTGAACPAGQCCGGNVCCGGGPSCVTESNNACGSTCDTCFNGASCAAHQCTCASSNVLLCHGAAGTQCCNAGQYCDAGACLSTTVNPCPGSASCTEDGGAIGCCRSTPTCGSPINSFTGCGATCADCTSGGCCCPDAGAGGTYGCVNKSPEAGASCPANCNP